MKKLSVKKLLVSVPLAALLIVLFSLFSIVMHYNDQATMTADCAVIFGAAVWRDDIPSQALYDRTMTAGELYKNNLVSCIILSGGESTYGTHEALVMQKILLENNIPNDILEIDRKGKNTTATLNNLDKSRSYTLVSNDFHLARINLLAHRADLEQFTLHRATYYNGRYAKEPYFLLREIIAIPYYFFGIHRVQSWFY